MNYLAFNELSDEIKLLMLQEAEVLTRFKYLSKIISLYAYNGYWVEEFRNVTTGKLLKIEAFKKANDPERSKIYSMYIKADKKKPISGVLFKLANKYSMVTMVCASCEYELCLDGTKPPKEAIPASCPICENTSFRLKTD